MVIGCSIGMHSSSSSDGPEGPPLRARRAKLPQRGSRTKSPCQYSLIMHDNSQVRPQKKIKKILE